MVVRILGPLEVICSGRGVPIRGGKERALVVRLALASGRAVSPELLVAALWDGEPPASVDASVRVLISRVRKALATVGADDIIRTRPPGYVLSVDEIDAVGFEVLSARGRGELADGRPDRAAATLTQALALWRGDTLAEVGSEYLRVEAARLDQTRLSVLEDRISADLACGRHAGVHAELEALCRTHPLREGLWALWITALYRCSRQADALAAYQELKVVLAEELGIDPSPRLQQLEAAVLAQDPMLAALASPRRPLDPSPVPLPESLAVVERAPLVGREQELQAARAALTAVCSGGGSGVLLVSGEAGIGKSRLVRELAWEAHQRGDIVLHGRCDEDLAIPYRPFVECLSHLIAHVSDAVLVDVDPERLAELSRLIPSLVARWPGLPASMVADSDVERYRLFGAVGSLLTAMARQSPVMVTLDDLQWADRPTLQLLGHLAGLPLGRVLLVGVHRDSERPIGPLVEMLGALPGQATVTRITPRGLTVSQAVTLMASTAGREPDEAGGALAGVMNREAGGNPFYLMEMFKHLLETAVITDLPDGRCTATVERTEVGLPASIRDVLRARLSRLGPETALVLSDAAVIGQEFDVDLLARATGLDEDHVLDLLEAAGRTALVAEAAEQPGRFRFAHALVQHTLYRDIGAARRTRAHARVAAAMEHLGGRQPGELAYHFLAGVTAATAGTAIHYARAAGQRALAASAPDEAARWYSAALNAQAPPRDDADHVRALLDLGVAQRQAGHSAYRDTLLTAAHTAERIGRADLLIEAALASNRGGFSTLGRIDAEKIAVLETALAITDLELAVRARLLAVLACELAWHPDHARRIATANEAVTVARRTGDPTTMLFAILRPGGALMMPETSEQRVQLFREAADLAKRVNDPIAHADAILMLAPTLLEAASADRLDEEVDAAAQVAAEIREPFMRWITRTVRGCLAIAHGDLERGEKDTIEALQIARDGGLPDTEAAHDQQLFIIRWHQGRLAEILDHVRGVGAFVPGATAWPELPLAEAICGDRQRARTMLDEAARAGFNSFYGAPWLGGMCLWADVAAELAEPHSGAILYAKLAPWKDLFGTGGPVPIHGVSLSLGRLAVLLGNTEAADRHFADSMRVHDAVRSPFGTAETAFHWGQLLLNRDPEHARTMLGTALQLASRYGFGDIERRADQTLRTR